MKKRIFSLLLCCVMLLSLLPTTVLAAETCNITAISEDETKGTVTGGGTYNRNENANLTATPKEGYVFEGWYKDGVKKSAYPEYSPMVQGDATYIAKFVVPNTLVTVANAVIDAPAEGANPDMAPEVPEADKDK